MKKVISVVLAITMLFSLVTMSFAGYKDDAKLQFNKNGKFKILCLADVQDDYPLEPAVLQFIREALDFANPDLVVFVGDNVVGEDIRAIDEMIAPLDERDIPFTFVFGNHDAEGNISRAQQMEVYEKYDCFVGCAGEDMGNYTCGTYYVPLYSSTDSEDMIFNLWMIDSLTYNRHPEDEKDVAYYENDLEGYACVHKDQIDWYVKTSNELKAANGGEPVPSMAFQHIIVKEIFELIESGENIEGALLNQDGRDYVFKWY